MEEDCSGCGELVDGFRADAIVLAMSANECITESVADLLIPSLDLNFSFLPSPQLR